MFEGWGVGLAVAELRPAAPVDAPGRPARLSDVLPVAVRSPEGKVHELGRVQQLKSAIAAYEADLIAGLAADRPATADLPAGAPGAAAERWCAPDAAELARLGGVSEFFPDELAQVLRCSRAQATTVAVHALTLVHLLPRTWAALADGRIDWPRARGLAQQLGLPGEDVDPAVLAEVEAAVLPRAEELSVTGLRALAERELVRRDPRAAERRRRRAQRAADVVLRPAPDGMAQLSVFLPAPDAAAVLDTADRYARLEKEAGSAEPIGVLRARAVTDLALRPWDTSRPPVTAHLTVLAPLPVLAGDDGVAEVEGRPITASGLRRVLEQLDSLCPGGLQAPSGGTLLLALTDPVTGRLRATVTRRELETRARRGCPQHPAADCGCPLLAEPAAPGRYRPTPAQRRFLRVRDQRCRMPGCSTRPGWADLDHVVPHDQGGETSCDNLCCLCRRHHRLKTFAPGWSFVMDDDGVLTVTTPSGVTRVTRPPGLDRRPFPPSAGPDGEGDDPPPF
ncbi:HNH endonuclease signature motif containing protein [Blastococcus sp. TF02A_35]|uniref:HNH endonuclease signature motif containing protein n=1 Tax=Blastococcus sp. TF02A-35 TaxID=2559612 RepID=UPI00107481F5|nr:HNH endonuclease signature motif containing protein [Blastococcus sp. TF02A_35]TFV52193.1 HNH endonuclease [Blastococcus sp. TF02A_35]